MNNDLVWIFIATLISAVFAILGNVVASFIQPRTNRQRIFVITFFVILIPVIIVVDVIRNNLTPIPRYEGGIAAFEDGNNFNNFIRSYEGEIVYFEIVLPGQLVGEGDIFSRIGTDVYAGGFQILEYCSEDVSRCSGNTYVIRNDNGKPYVAAYEYGRYRIKGYFEIMDLDGPHQGVYGVDLRPVAVEDIESR